MYQFKDMSAAYRKGVERGGIAVSKELSKILEDCVSQSVPPEEILVEINCKLRKFSTKK
jgi:hypothetical protein